MFPLLRFSSQAFYLIFSPIVFSANSSPKIFKPQLRIEGLSLTEQNELKGAAWFQAGIPREISLEVLSRQNPGAFLVRQSSTKQGCFALSLRVPPPAPKVAHYLIMRTPRGYKIKVSSSNLSEKCPWTWTAMIHTQLRYLISFINAHVK